jgi:hypothetical protein
MPLTRYFRKLSLSSKLLLLLIFFLVLFATTVSFVRIVVFKKAAVLAGTQQAVQEIELITNQFDEVQTDLLLSAKLLATTPGLAEAIQHEDRNTLVARTLTGISNLNLDTIDVIDLNSEIITANDRGKAHFEAADKQEMFRLGLLGIETTKLIVHQLDQEALELMLTAVTAVRDEDGNFVGAILVGRQLDSDQLAHLNFNREDVHLLLIHDSQVVVQDSVSIAKKEEHNHQIETQDNHLVLDGTEIDTAVLQQVLSGSSSSVIPGNNPDFPPVIALSP